MDKDSEESFRLRAQIAEEKLSLIYGSVFWRISKPIRVLLRKFHFVSKSHSKLNSSKFEGAGSKIQMVRDLINEDIKITHGGHKLTSSKIATIAHWSTDSLIDESTKVLVYDLLACGFEVIIVSANLDLKFETREFTNSNKLHIITKPNIGYDFGSWLAGLIKFPEIFDSNELILLNNSCIGPFSDLSEYLSEMKKLKFDVVAFTDSQKLHYHLQSYFLYFKKSAITSQAFKDFFLQLPILENKHEMISRYEINLTNQLLSSGLHCGSLFSWNLYSKPWENPTIDQAMELISDGFPFIKKEALRLSGVGKRNRIISAAKSKFPKRSNLINDFR